MMRLFALVLAAGIFAAPAWSINLKLPNVTACKPVMDACMKAGKQGKDATNCVDNIRKGGSVKDVKIKPDDLKSCVMSMKK